MKALSYLIIMQLKNRILALKKKPAFLVLYAIIFVVVLISVVMLVVFDKEVSSANYADERMFFLILAGFGLLFLYSFIVTGVSTGSSLFTMPDVGLLFVAPISSKKILMYGLLSTLGKSLLGCVFIFYQIGTLKTNFGYGITEIFALFLLLSLMLLYCQILSIGIYIFSNGNQRRKNLVKFVLYALIGAILLAMLLLQRQEQIGILETAMRVVTSDWFGYLPVAGWAIMFFTGVVHGSMLSVIVSVLLFIVTGSLMICLLTTGKADYYEDVLLSTETTFQLRQAAKDGSYMPRTAKKKIKLKEKEMGILKGKGAMTFLYKHILEMRRKSRFIFIDGSSVFLMLGVGIIGYNLKVKSAPEVVNYIILATMIYIQFFFTIMGRLKGELIKPYIYLIPEKSIKKVFAASLTSLIKPFIDGFLIYGVFAVFNNANPLECIFFALAYGASGAVFVGLTVLYQRVLGGQPSKMIQMLVVTGLLILIMAPSITASIVAAFLLPDAFKFLCTLPYTMFCLLFTTILFKTNGNLIDKSEYTGQM